ncbi:MAG: preprotein translocase subunit SecF [Euryarchaeota archaeon]|nr:preprotein translocase subunit SecF [Euryarchaeota archaeon]
MIHQRLAKVNMKSYVPLTLGLLVLGALFVGMKIHTGTLPMSIDFKYGTLVTVYGYSDSKGLESDIKERFGFDVTVDTVRDYSTGESFLKLEIEKPGGETLTGEEESMLKDFLVERGVEPGDISIKTVGPFLSERFLREAVKAILFAFGFMAAVVFLRFKTYVPSVAVVLSALSDIVLTVAVMALLGIELSLGTLVALLLLIGYSVDTDIMLTSRLLVKRSGSYQERLAGAMKTGFTMSGTTFTAVFIFYFATSSLILKEIASVIAIGLVIDLVNTWVQNTGILQWYLESGRR